MTVLAIPALLMSLSIAVLSMNQSWLGPIRGTAYSWPLILLISGSFMFMGLFVVSILYKRWGQVEQTMDILQVGGRAVIVKYSRVAHIS